MTDQGYVALLDQVFRSGEPIKRISERVLLRWTAEGPLVAQFLVWGPHC
ncbi:hypothetical protein [Ensifer canadensis]|nr:hypothetical protein [Ensifer canadensis]